MRNPGRRFSSAEIALLVALAAWGLFPVVLLLVHAGQTHTSLTGADGLIGADGILGADQLQYLAWARDSGTHGLASDLFTLTPTGHVYLEPVFAVTGALWRAGLSLPLAYLLWKPVAIVGMFLAGVAWARRAFGEQFAARAATVALALFLFTPIDALVTWTQSGSTSFRFQIYLLGDELLGADKIWGYIPSALALALVPVALLAAERALDPYLGTRPAHRAMLRSVRPGPLVLSAVAGGLATWLHPWQGITLIVIYIAVGVWQREKGGVALIVPALGAALPLLYYYLLREDNAAWALASHYEQVGRLSPLVLLAGFGPLFVFAAAGLRNPRDSVFEQIQLVWIPAAFVTYWVNGAFPPHAFQGVTFPLAVLAVRGAQRLRLGLILGTLAVLVATVPGLAYNARKFVRTADRDHVQYYLPAGDAAALAWIDGHAAAGGVLAPMPISVVVPSQTGHAVWIGDGYWSQDYFARLSEVRALFKGHLRPRAALAFVRSTGARLLLSDCQHRHDVGRALAPAIASTHHFGCARVYVLRGRSVSR
jgi:hypothetical protein